MPSRSQAQQRFFGMVHGLQKGTVKPSSVSSKVRKAAKSMTKKQTHDFAATSRKGLPQHVKKESYNYGPSTCKTCGATHKVNKTGTCKFCAIKNEAIGTEYTCPKDGRKFYSKVAYETHMKTHKQNESKLDEKWESEAPVKQLNKYGKEQQSIADLKSKRSALKAKSSRTPAQSKELKRINFAIRARTGWGKVGENTNPRGTMIREDSYESGIHPAAKDTFRVGTAPSKKVRTATSAETSADREDLGRNRALENPDHIKMIENFNEHGASLKRTNKMRDIAQKLSEIAEMAESYTMNEADDWFDKHTVSRNMKEMKKYAGEFGKLANEADSLHERMTALYDDMGHVLNRYFEIKEPASRAYANQYDPQDPNAPQGIDLRGVTEASIEEKALSKPFQCQECGKRLTTAQAEKAMYGDKGCPGCGGSDIDIASGVDEIKDAHWLTTKDKVLATTPRNVQDFEDRGKIDEDDDIELGDQGVDMDRSPNADLEHERDTILRRKGLKKEISDDKYMTNNDRVLATKARNVQDFEDRKHGLTEADVDTTSDDLKIAQAKLNRANKIASQAKSPTRRTSAQTQAEKARNAINKIRQRSSQVKEAEGAAKPDWNRLSPPEKHQLSVARRSVQMNPAMTGVMGGPSAEEAKKIISRLTRKAKGLPPVTEEGDKEYHKRLLLGRMVKELRKKAMRRRNENAEVSPSNLGTQKITQKQWDDTPAGAKVTIGGKKGILRPAGQNPVKDTGGATFVQPVEISKREDDEVGSDSKDIAL